MNNQSHIDLVMYVTLFDFNALEINVFLAIPLESKDSTDVGRSINRLETARQGK
jgi:hypothetical protein